MTRIFLETLHHPAFRYGGWGLAWETGGTVRAQAGGERNTTAQRIDLMALIAALEGAPAGPVAVHSASPGVVRAVRLLAASPPPGSEDAPAEDLDLWALALKAAAGKTPTMAAASIGPTAFLKAWAEVGQDKAKGKGRFDAAIPKTNLAKLALP